MIDSLKMSGLKIVKKITKKNDCNKIEKAEIALGLRVPCRKCNKFYLKKDMSIKVFFLDCCRECFDAMVEIWAEQDRIEVEERDKWENYDDTTSFNT